MTVQLFRDSLDSNFLPTAPIRVVGTTFQPSIDRPVLVSYTIEISVTSVLLGNGNRTVTLLSDAGSPPTTPRVSTRCQLGGVVATNIQRGQLIYLVPKGHFVLISITATNGTGSVTIIEQVEEVL